MISLLSIEIRRQVAFQVLVKLKVAGTIATSEVLAAEGLESPSLFIDAAYYWWRNPEANATAGTSTDGDTNLRPARTSSIAFWRSEARRDFKTSASAPSASASREVWILVIDVTR